MPREEPESASSAELADLAGRSAVVTGGAQGTGRAAIGTRLAKAAMRYITSAHAVTGEPARHNVGVPALEAGTTPTESVIEAAARRGPLNKITLRPVRAASGRPGMPHDAARVVSVAVTGLAGFVTGSTLVVEGGYDRG